MAKEALNSPYNKLLFRETFRSESETRRNGGQVTAVDFSNGVATLDRDNSALLSFNSYLNGTYSLRIKLKINELNSSLPPHIWDFRASSGTGDVSISENAAKLITATSGTVYVNGVVHSSALEEGVWYDIVISGISVVSTTPVSIGCAYVSKTSQRADWDIELMEYYQGTLTVSEIKNLYAQTWNKEQSFGGSPKSNLVTNGGFDTDTDWTKGTAGWTISNGKAHCDGEDTVANFSQAINIVGGKKYTCTFTVSNYVSGTLKVYASTTGLLGSITANGTYSLSGYAVGVATTINFLSNSNFIGSIDNVTVQELNPKTLLDFDSTNGVLDLGDYTNTATATDVTIKKIGQSYSADFNGSTSLIDTGSDMIGTKAVTIMAWIKRYSKGEGNGGAIIDNGKLTLRDVNNALDYLYFTGNGSSGAITSYYLPMNIHMFIAVTRESDGTVNFFIGDTKTAPALSGSADQSSGTPEAGTSNVIIGNNAAGTRTFDGLEKKLIAVEGILTPAQLTQWWSETLKEIK